MSEEAKYNAFYNDGNMEGNLEIKKPSNWFWSSRYIRIKNSYLKIFKKKSSTSSQKILDLSEQTNVVCKDETQINIYCKENITLQIKCENSNECKKWRNIIHKIIEKNSYIDDEKSLKVKQSNNAIYKVDDVNDLTIKKAMKLPNIKVQAKEIKKKNYIQKYGQSSGTGTQNDVERIHYELSIDNRKDLKCRYVLKGKHPELMIYADPPKYDDNPFVRIDMIYKDVDGAKKNRIRFQGKTWGSIKNNNEYKVDKQEYVLINKTIPQIRNWCINWENKNKANHNDDYALITNNCRKFMIALSSELKIPFPYQWVFEPQFYSTAKTVKDSSGSPNNREMNGDQWLKSKDIAKQKTEITENDLEEIVNDELKKIAQRQWIWNWIYVELGLPLKYLQYFRTLGIHDKESLLDQNLSERHLKLMGITETAHIKLILLSIQSMAPQNDHNSSKTPPE